MGDDAQDSGSNSLDGGEATDVTSVEVRVFITVLYAGFLWGMHWFAGRVDQGRILQQEAKLPPADLERMDVERDEIEALKKKRGRVGKTVVKCIMFDGEILPLWKYIVWRNPYFSLYFDGHQFNTRKRTDKLGKGVMMPCKNADKWPDPLSQGCTCWRLYWSLMWPKFKRDKRDVPQSIRRAVFGASMMFSIVLSMAFSKLVGVPKTPGATCNDANDISQLANCKFDTEFSWELSLIVALMSMPLATVLNRLGDAMSRSSHEMKMAFWVYCLAGGPFMICASAWVTGRTMTNLMFYIYVAAVSKVQEVWVAKPLKTLGEYYVAQAFLVPEDDVRIARWTANRKLLMEDPPTLPTYKERKKARLVGIGSPGGAAGGGDSLQSGLLAGAAPTGATPEAGVAKPARVTRPQAAAITVAANAVHDVLDGGGEH